jgi:hypothetical protein
MNQTTIHEPPLQGDLTSPDEGQVVEGHVMDVLRFAGITLGYQQGTKQTKPAPPTR